MLDFSALYKSGKIFFFTNYLMTKWLWHTKVDMPEKKETKPNQ